MLRNKIKIPWPARSTTLYALAAVGTGLVYGLHLTVVLDTVILVGATAVGTVLITVAARRHSPGTRLPWYLFAAGELGWTLAWIAWQTHILGSGTPLAPGTPTDLLFVSGYAFMVVALLVVMRRQGGGLGSLLDVGIVTSALLLVAWVFVVPDDVLLMSEVLRETRISSGVHVAMDGEEAMDFLRREGQFADALSRISCSSISTCRRRTDGKSCPRSRQTLIFAASR